MRTFEFEFHCFDTIIAMICVSDNNHFSCVIPPCFVRNDVTVLKHHAAKCRWFLIVGSMMLLVVEFASAKYLYFNALTDDVAKIRVRNLRQTHINIDARISKKTCLLADNCRRFADHNKPWQRCGFLWNTGLETGVGVKCGIIMFDFLCCKLSPFCGVCALLVVL